MKKTAFTLLLLFPLLLNAQFTIEQLIDKMVASINTVKTATYTLSKAERIEGKMRYGIIDVRLQSSPFKVYLHVKAPDDDKDTEILYVDGERGGDVLVNPNSIPFNVNLSPTSDKLVEKEHHPVMHSGFTYFRNIITQMRKVYADKIYDYCKLSIIKWSGAEFYKIEINFPDYAYENYTVQAGEDLIKIARKKFISEYMVKEINKLKAYDAVKAGQVIKVPNVYAKKTVIYLDKATFLPVFQQMYDEKGLYEEYTITGLKVNPKFPSDEFTKGCSGYNF